MENGEATGKVPSWLPFSLPFPLFLRFIIIQKEEGHFGLSRGPFHEAFVCVPFPLWLGEQQEQGGGG